jgi:hypothetical protein
MRNIKMKYETENENYYLNWSNLSLIIQIIMKL